MSAERPRPKKGMGVGQTIGGILVGFDQQVWRHQPPAQERVVEVDRLGTAITPSGLTIEMPDARGLDGERPEPTPERDETAGPGRTE